MDRALLPDEPALFDLPDDGGPAPRAHGGLLAGLDWEALYRELNTRGVALTPPLLTPGECAALAATGDRPELFRSRVTMARHGFGSGGYAYYADATTPEPVRALRMGLYPGMAWMANRWAALLGERRYPATLDALLAECAERGQHRPTPLLLRYGPGDWAGLHQDVYGELVFPLQVAVLLSAPDTDFTGGESVFVEQRPQAQSRAVVVRPGLGQGVIFPVRHRPVRGPHGIRRHTVRHGTGEVLSGRRAVLGVIFHNAR
ncbi:2OG-Fe(II) oxygenase [Streptomyces sp. LP05-1]|uniref:2OG-Fe(II) oxygenase n=1 Tax=Streptomyces pyxinae TaxID=2970734 RepID=A0ABT2CK62_9ACTN|nr:2OG-Fe(II) oxygenase [Streptomyces sp. LP05-1]MCS0637803.1 2OG-Fe(II) oxygenase [Streptomyces sp. LP05-1]